MTLLPELNRDIRIHLILLVEPQNPMTDFTRRFRSHGIEVTRLVIRNHLDVSVVWKIYYLIRKIRPHIVHTHLLHADLYGILAATLTGTKIIISTKHGYDNYEKTSVFYKLNSISNKWVNKIITISHALQSKVTSSEGIDNSKMTTIYYGLDGEKYESKTDTGLAKSIAGVTNDVCIMGSVGRLVPVKGYEILLEALAGIDFDFRLLILGDGPLKGPLERMCVDFNLSGKVKFLGFVPDVSRILSGLDIFVLPTLGEGFGLVLLEAMAHHLPIISTNAMAVPEIVENHKAGLLVPPKDIKALRETIKKLMNSPEKRMSMGERGYEKLLKTFSVERMVERTKNLYLQEINIFSRHNRDRT